jgi:uncharacterized protein
MDKVPRPALEQQLATALSQAPAVVLIGARQVGKTTLARDLADRLRQQQDVLVLDLERVADARRLEDAEALLRSRIGQLTVIDEVHRAPGLFEQLRVIIDEARRAGQRAGQFLLLGSASLDLIQSTSETLAGRVRYLEQMPIQPLEALDAGIALPAIWLRGGFPESLLAQDDAASLAWRQDFIRSYLERDIPMFAPRLPAALIGRLWRMLAAGQGGLFHASRLATSLGVASTTVDRYVDLLVDLLLVRRLQPWSANLGKRLVRSPKLYVRDSGLVHALLEIPDRHALLGHPVVGFSWEGHVVDALIAAAGSSARPYFYRTSNGAEIDLVFERAGAPFVGIEIKLSSAPKAAKGFHLACDDLGIPHRLLVHGGSDPAWTASGGVEMAGLAEAIALVQQHLAQRV